MGAPKEIPALQVTASVLQGDGSQTQSQFVIERAPTLLRGLSRREIARIHYQLLSTPGTADSITLQSGKVAGENVVTKQHLIQGVTEVASGRELRLSRRTSRRIGAMLAEVHTVKDEARMQDIASGLHVTVAGRMDALHERMRKRGTEAKVGKVRAEMARKLMFPHNDMHRYVAQRLMHKPDDAVHDLTRFITKIHLQHKDRKKPLLYRMFPYVWSIAVSASKKTRWLASASDDALAVVDAFGPGSDQGKRAELLLASTSDVASVLVSKVDLPDQAAGIAELGITRLFDPADSEQAVRDIDDEYFALHAESIIDILQNGSGISEHTRSVLAHAVLKHINARQAKRASKFATSESGTARAEFGTLYSNLYNAAQKYMEEPVTTN